MNKVSAFLGALLFACLAAKTHAAHPLDLPPVPESSPALPASHTLPPTPKILASNPATFRPTSDFIVGKDTRLTLSPLASPDWRYRPSLDQRAEWDFLRQQTAGPGDLERFADRFDIEEHEQPWATTTTVRFLAATKGWLVPFASIAHEVDVNEDFERFGIGAGIMVILGKNATLGTELMYFGGDRSATNDAFGNETLFLTRLQLEF